MELLFESTNRFEKDLKSFDKPDKKRIINALNQYGSEVRDDPSVTPHRVRPLRIPQLKDVLDTTLYELRVSPKIRVILTLDEDPIFDQIIIGLLRVARHDKMKDMVSGLWQSLYQNMRNKDAEDFHG